MGEHKDLAAAEVDRVGYIQNTDPGAIGALRLWIVTDDDTTPTTITGVKLRNADDSAFLDVPIAGAPGADGVDGVDGADGADGSRLYNGSGAPAGGLGVDGDYYLDTDTGDLYSKAAGSWSVVGNLKGADGAPGADGANGADGADGADGLGVPVGGTTGQILAKASNADNDTEWVDPTSGSVDDTAYDATSWDGDTTHAPSKNAVRDKIELIETEIAGKAATSHTHAASDIASGTIAQARLGSGSVGAGTKFLADDQTYKDPVAHQAEVLIIAVSDESTALTTGTTKVTFRMPFAMTLTEVRASLTTSSSSGNPAIDINESGASIFSTTLTIDSGEKTSTTATTAAVISDASLADDAEMTIDIDTAGTGAKGLKVYLIGTRT